MPIVPPTRPRYKNVPGALGLVLWHLARGAPASLARVEERIFADMTPPPRVSGAENIPADSPFVVVFNHYEDKVTASWWGPFLMTGTIAERRKHAKPIDSRDPAKRGGSWGEPGAVRWLMANEWWYPGGFGRLAKQPLTRMLFGRIAKVYGFVLVPPVLDGDLTRGQGVAGVRQALALTRGEHPALVGLAPEGNTGPGGTLKEPPVGVGLFLLRLTHNTIPLLPIGWYQDEQGVVTINFGSPFQLARPEVKDRNALDRAIAADAMRPIGRLLPERLWGAYRTELEKEKPYHEETQMETQ